MILDDTYEQRHHDGGKNGFTGYSGRAHQMAALYRSFTQKNGTQAVTAPYPTGLKPIANAR